ncbi:MAG: TIGR00153 family protein [Elusimicrobiota bacterium]
MRAIISKIFRKKSPFSGLVEHAEKVREGAHKLKKAVVAYFDGDYNAFEKLSREIMEIENDADWIKGNIRAHMPKGIFIPVSKGDLLGTLKEQDAILDACEDAVIWISFKQNHIESDFKKEIEKYMDKIIDIVEDLEMMVKDIHRVITSISLKERKQIKNKIKNIHFEEEKTDEMERILIKKIFASGEKMINIYHLIHVVFLLGKIADHAENVGDGIRVMLAK